MDDQSIEEVVSEIRSLLIGRSSGKIFQLGKTTLAFDFGLRESGYLLISVEPASPRLYLIARRVRDLEKQSVPLTTFGLTARKELAGTQITAIDKHIDDRIVRIAFAGHDELGSEKERTIIAQLTGRSANLFLINEENRIIQSARSTETSGQRAGDIYHKPTSDVVPAQRASELLRQIRSHESSSASAAADAYFTGLLQKNLETSRIAAARAEIRRKIAQQQKLLKQLERDLQTHANPEKQKRVGDLLLANLST